MKRVIVIVITLAAAGLAGAQMFAQLFGGETWTPAALNPIAWYKGDGNVTDSMGNYNGTWVGTEAYTNGVAGQALSFSAAVIIMTATPYTTAIDRSRGFTVCAWLKRRDNFNDYGDLSFTKGIDVIKLSLVSDRNDQYRGRFVDASGTIRDTAMYTHPINEWVHVALHIDDTKGTLFINGQAYSSTVSHTTAYTLADCFFSLGGYRVGRVSNPNDFDDVLIFDRALTTEEIEKIYTESINKNGKAW